MSTLHDRLRERAEATLDASWSPALYDLSRADHRAEVEALLARPDVMVHDEIFTQLVGLVETRDPAKTLSRSAIEERARAQLGEAPEAYGTWVWYPWSRRLVHVLPEAEFRELRTSRNRNKITAEEQERLRGLRIGIVGLSIGQAAAVTLTLEEIGGFLALADFDHLELSNLNRLRAGVHSLGVGKAALAAREIYEINPYTRVEIWTEGVRPDNIDAFLCTGGRPLDLVYEECDDLQSKVLVRERARHHRIPVLMETSDRGLMDVERFDLEPDRPIFHGLIPDVRAEELAGLTTYEKVPLVMQIHGRTTLSDRMAASMVDIESTLASWPQLASEVALGAGINVDTARRIALGELNRSGRFYVDMHAAINDEVAARPIPKPPDPPLLVSAEAHALDLPQPTVVQGPLRAEDVRVLVAWATTAFSGGNTQPWLFHWSGDRLVLLHDTTRSGSFLDVDERSTFLAFGSVLENLVLTAPMMGLRADVRLFPDRSDPRRVADVLLTRSDVPTHPLARLIPHRVTNRQLGQDRPLDPIHRDRMTAAAALHGARLHWLEERPQLDRIGDILGRADRVRLTCEPLHRDMMAEMRWSLEEVERTRDGIDLATMEFTPADLAGIRMASSWSVMRMVKTMGGVGLERMARKSVARASAVGLLTVDGLDPASFVRAGRGLHRLWLQAAADGLALQPMTSVTYMFYRLLHLGGEGFDAREREVLTALRHRWAELFPTRPDEAEPMLFRVAYAPPPTARSLRRAVDDVMVPG